MIVLYGTQGSGAAAIEIALDLAGAPFRMVDAASWKPGPGLYELRRVNPLAQIPTVVLPEGGILTESAAILIHLAERYPDAGLLPAAPAARAQAIRGLVYIASNCYAAIGVIDFPERYCTDVDDALADRIRSGTRHRLHELWDVFADMFPAGTLMDGDRLGALDVLAAVVSRWSGARKHLETSRPEFHALHARVETHPVVARVFARHWPPQ